MYYNNQSFTKSSNFVEPRNSDPMIEKLTSSSSEYRPGNLSQLDVDLVKQAIDQTEREEQKKVDDQVKQHAALVDELKSHSLTSFADIISYGARYQTEVSNKISTNRRLQSENDDYEAETQAIDQAGKRRIEALEKELNDAVGRSQRENQQVDEQVLEAQQIFVAAAAAQFGDLSIEQ